MAIGTVQYLSVVGTLFKEKSMLQMTEVICYLIDIVNRADYKLNYALIVFIDSISNFFTRITYVIHCLISDYL